ncbi:43254_t:CDS:2, partial [Gigaspora margarita]
LHESSDSVLLDFINNEIEERLKKFNREIARLQQTIKELEETVEELCKTNGKYQEEI